MKKLFISILLSFTLVQTVFAEGYYYLYDHLGNVDVVTDETGEAVATYEYDPYGNTIEENIYDEDFENDYKYTGQEEDDETGLYYYNARYYSPKLGRFMSQDPAVYDDRLFEMLSDPQSLNPYTYARNNPVKYVDPSGELPKPVWSIIIANCLYMGGYNITADLLNISVQGQISELGGVQYFQNDSNIAEEIRGSDVYRDDVLSVIYDSIDNGTLNGIFKEETIEFNEGDLGKSLHGMKESSWRAVKQRNGSYNIYIILKDIYDFKYEESDEYGDVYTWANNEAYKDQEEGDLTTYDIKIYMQESYTPSAEDN